MACKMYFVIVCMVKMCLLTIAVNAKHCSSSDKICVPIKSCPFIYEIATSAKVKTSIVLQEFVRARTCWGKGMKRRVCCPLKGPGEQCITMRNISGKCVAAEQCRSIVRYQQKGKSAKAEKNLEKNICYHDRKNGKKYYCCQTTEVLDTPSKIPKHRRTESTKILPMSSVPTVENIYKNCTDSTGASGLCVPVRNCYGIHSDILNHSGNEDYIRNSRCLSDAKDGYAICCVKNRKGYKATSYIHHPVAQRLGLTKCGPVRMVDKVFKGGVARFGQYPWMAYLMYTLKESFCSGSLIHSKYVLTAAHCMAKYRKPVSVRLGEYNLMNDPDCVDDVCAGSFKEYGIEKLIPNDYFNGQTADNDIALILLKKEVILVHGEIYPICLPLSDDLLMLQPRKMTVTGWGMTEHQVKSSVILEAELQIAEWMSLCAKESTFCARGKNMEGHCQGDSGGPYQTVVYIDGEYKYVQYGVISGGQKNCNVDLNRPGVGVKVAFHIKWILDNMDI